MRASYTVSVSHPENDRLRNDGIWNIHGHPGTEWRTQAPKGIQQKTRVALVCLTSSRAYPESNVIHSSTYKNSGPTTWHTERILWLCFVVFLFVLWMEIYFSEFFQYKRMMRVTHRIRTRRMNDEEKAFTKTFVDSHRFCCVPLLLNTFVWRDTIAEMPRQRRRTNQQKCARKKIHFRLNVVPMRNCWWSKQTSSDGAHAVEPLLLHFLLRPQFLALTHTATSSVSRVGVRVAAALITRSLPRCGSVSHFRRKTMFL